jgi:nitroreductase
MDVLETIRNRRSIRHYKPDPVDDETVLAVLEAAHWAPSWTNQQCWRFIVVRDPTLKGRLADTLGKVLVDNEMVENAAAGGIRQAPVLVVVCAEPAKAGYRPDGSIGTEKGQHWFMFDVALAVQNLVLAAHARGLGTVIVGGFDTARVGQLLNVPEGLTVVTMTPLGVPAHGGQVSPRKPLTEVVFREQYGKK